MVGFVLKDGFASSDGLPAGKAGRLGELAPGKQRGGEVTMSEQTPGAPDYDAGSEEDERQEAPSGKEALTPGDQTLPDDQATFQPESS